MLLNKKPFKKGESIIIGSEYAARTEGESTKDYFVD